MTPPSRTTVPRTSMNQASSNLTEEESEARNSCEINSPVKEQKRQKILAIARKEEEDYKKYKESLRLNNVCETPRATGGVLPREEVIKKYETQVKTAKYKAKIRKDTYKEEQKRIEEEKINAKKEAARRQAEKNALIEKQHLQEHGRRLTDETRRNRLRYFENVSASRNELSKNDSGSCSKMNTSWDYEDNCEAKDLDQSSLKCSDIQKTPEETNQVQENGGDELLSLIRLFPELDVQLLNDVYNAQGKDLAKTINFFQ